MQTIPEVIARWRREEISGCSLMRALVGYQGWCIPITEAAAVEMVAETSGPRISYSRDAEGVNRLLVFSSTEAMHTYCQAAGLVGEQHLLTTTGAWVFTLLMEGIDEIHIDPLSPDDVFYKQEQFGRLREVAAAMAVEAALTGLRQGKAADGAMQLVKEYPNYQVPARIQGENIRLVLMPDERGRRLMPIFTLNDTLACFLPAISAGWAEGESQTQIVGGAELFDLLSNIDIDGMVFNCGQGPVPPVAFAKGFAQLVCEA